MNLQVATLSLLLTAVGGSLPLLHAQQPVFSTDEEVESVVTKAGPISVKEVTSGLEQPWGLAFLPDGRALVSEKPGRLRVLELDGTLSTPLKGVPEVFSMGQGGLLDVEVDPDYADNGWIYLVFAEPEGPAASTALGRARLEGQRLVDWEVIFRQAPKIIGPNHFGGRLEFSGEDHLFLSMGERFQFEPAQDLSNHLGTIVRLHRDGSIPEDNPFVGQDGAMSEIWSYGHRNIEASAIHPETGELWIMEMGPLGGDELNQPKKGENHGWPIVSWGYHYSGEPIPDPPTRPEFADAVKQFSPVVSPSGMIFYEGEVYPEWKDSFFVGSLSAHQLVRLVVDGDEVVEEERIPLGERIREVTAGPDGYIYLTTDQRDEKGAIWRLELLRAPSD
ncbi:MAG: PQQ-dependent sugar dehydrogenase [Verrucomicrobiota bacterium]